VLHHELAARFKIDSPRILVAGAQPAAGESGHLGREEIEVIVPVLETLRTQGLARRVRFLSAGALAGRPANTLSQFCKHFVSA
jgi:4-hydroxy-L-threonine phosphate dehydrogenase PdxA